MKEIIEKFIKENKLDLNDTGSALNSTCCIISGYALHIGIIDVDILCNMFVDKLNADQNLELEKVFNYAKKHQYEDFWKTEQAEKQYIFSKVKNI